jgi:hypothetical protein
MNENTVFAVINNLKGDFGFLEAAVNKLPAGIKASAQGKLDFIALIGDVIGDPFENDTERNGFNAAWETVLEEYDRERLNLKSEIKDPYTLWEHHAQANEPQVGSIFRQYVGLIEQKEASKEDSTGRLLVEKGVLADRIERMYRGLAQIVIDSIPKVKIMVTGSTPFQEKIPEENRLDWSSFDIRGKKFAAFGLDSYWNNPPESGQEIPHFAYSRLNSHQVRTMPTSSFLSEARSSHCVFVPKLGANFHERLMSDTGYLIVTSAVLPIPIFTSPAKQQKYETGMSKKVVFGVPCHRTAAPMASVYNLGDD